MLLLLLCSQISFRYVLEGDGKEENLVEIFVELGCKAFAVLRKNANLLLHLCMLMYGPEATQDTRQRLGMHLKLETEEQVNDFFKKVIDDASKNWLASFYNLCHQIKITSSGGSFSGSGSQG
eukprot:tig00000626_g2666.t1